MADASRSAVGRLPVDRSPLRVVPVLTRVDKDEYEAPYWAYGERLAALRTEVVSSLSVGRAHQNLAAVLARGLSEAGLLVKHRDSYVDGATVGASPPTTLATSRTFDVYLSYPRSRGEFALALAHALRRRSIEVFIDRLALQPGDPWQVVLADAQRRSRTFVVLVGHEPGPIQSQEIAAILDRVREGVARVVPVALAGWDHVPDALRAYQGLDPLTLTDGSFDVERLADLLTPVALR